VIYRIFVGNKLRAAAAAHAEDVGGVS